MILKDFIFRFPTRTFSKRDGLCRVRIFNDREGKQIVLITDIGNKNPSSSVTNEIEIILGKLIEQKQVNADAIVTLDP